MGKEQKKGEKGAAANYITRNLAIRKLQISLKDFRRLCILKGIFPRDPKRKNKLKGSNKTYYHVKDIKFLAHEPLLVKFREMKTFIKKYKRAVVRKEFDRADKLKELKPQFKFDHLVKERYPQFVDALRDVDDPLCMVHLFAALPSKIIKTHTAERASMCLRLCREFQAYNVHAKTLRKVFISIKGIYYQAEIQGQPITWLTPHKFSQYVPSDVDYRVMLTFLEFYETLLRFAHFKLYHQLGLVYPPKLDMALDANDSWLSALQITTLAASGAGAADSGTVSGTSTSRAAQKVADKAAKARPDKALQAKVTAALSKVSQAGKGSEDANGGGADENQPMASADDSKLDDFSQLDPTGASGPIIPLAETDKVASLFKDCVFALNREVPRDSLEFVILCGGGKVLKVDKLTEEELKSSDITHQVVDKVVPAAGRVAKREYVQPQWVYDCFNWKTLLPTQPYAPGVVPPPHLSPFVNNKEEGYVPKQAEILREWGADIALPAKADADDGESVPSTAAAASASSASGSKKKPDATARKGKRKRAGEEDEEAVAEDAHQAEAEYLRDLAKERAGVSFSKAQEGKGGAEEADDIIEGDDEDDDEDLALLMSGGGDGEGVEDSDSDIDAVAEAGAGADGDGISEEELSAAQQALLAAADEEEDGADDLDEDAKPTAKPSASKRQKQAPKAQQQATAKSLADSIKKASSSSKISSPTPSSAAAAAPASQIKKRKRSDDTNADSQASLPSASKPTKASKAQKGIAADATPTDATDGKASKKASKASKSASAPVPADSDQELAKIMMTKKNKRLYDRIQFGNKKKQDTNERLMSKRLALEDEEKGLPSQEEEPSASPPAEERDDAEDDAPTPAASKGKGKGSKKGKRLPPAEKFDIPAAHETIKKRKVNKKTLQYKANQRKEKAKKGK